MTSLARLTTLASESYWSRVSSSATSCSRTTESSLRDFLRGGRTNAGSGPLITALSSPSVATSYSMRAVLVDVSIS